MLPPPGSSNRVWGEHCYLWYQRNDPTHELAVYSAQQWTDHFDIEWPRSIPMEDAIDDDAIMV